MDKHRMKVTLTGASGFIGPRLIARLLSGGHQVHVLGRRPPAGDIPFSKWDAEAPSVPKEALDGVGAVVNLAGEPIAQRWNSEIKRRIRDSRIVGTRNLVQAIADRSERPRVFVSASAIGYYGDRGEEVLTEASKPGNGFLPDICREWEDAANEADGHGVRTALLRIGIVLGKEGGALKQMLPPFRLGVGGPMASGKQWMSWIHVDDLVEGIVHSVENSVVSGPVNATAPIPVKNREFANALGEALHRPAMLTTPTFALKLMLGEAAQVVLGSQRVLPKGLESTGFRFRYPDVRSALAAAVA
jgi:uncharacterized protein (TIGR01777 family)